MALQHPVPEPLLARIGDITVSFALLEFTVEVLAMTLLEQDSRISRIVTSELSFGKLRDLVASLYLERRGEGSNLDALRVLLRRAERIEGRRNQIMHSVWGKGTTDDTISRIKTTARAKRGLDISFSQLSEKDLANLAMEIKVLAGDVQRFDFSLHELAPGDDG